MNNYVDPGRMARYLAGATDEELAAYEYVELGTIKSWRWHHGRLPKNGCKVQYSDRRREVFDVIEKNAGIPDKVLRAKLKKIFDIKDRAAYEWIRKYRLLGTEHVVK